MTVPPVVAVPQVEDLSVALSGLQGVRGSRLQGLTPLAIDSRPSRAPRPASPRLPVSASPHPRVPASPLVTRHSTLVILPVPASPLVTRHSTLVILPVVLLVMMLAAAGCSNYKDRSGLLHGIPTQKVRMENPHTGVEDLTITIPSRYVVEWTKESRYEKYFVYVPGDTGDVQRAMALIDITPTPPKQIPDTAEVDRSVGRIAGHDVEWRERMVEDPDGGKLYQREMVTRELLHGKDMYHTTGPISMHVLVVGSDREEVERLMASVETLTPLPVKPNL